MAKGIDNFFEEVDSLLEKINRKLNGEMQLVKINVDGYEGKQHKKKKQRKIWPAIFWASITFAIIFKITLLFNSPEKIDPPNQPRQIEETTAVEELKQL
jgi:hypothetical protein